eukprot:228809_1
MDKKREKFYSFGGLYTFKLSMRVGYVVDEITDQIIIRKNCEMFVPGYGKLKGRIISIDPDTEHNKRKKHLIELKYRDTQTNEMEKMQKRVSVRSAVGDGVLFIEKRKDQVAGFELRTMWHILELVPEARVKDIDEKANSEFLQSPQCWIGH